MTSAIAPLLASVSLTAELQHVDSLSEIGTKLGLVLVIFSSSYEAFWNSSFYTICSQGDHNVDRRRDNMHRLSLCRYEASRETG